MWLGERLWLGERVWYLCRQPRCVGPQPLQHSRDSPLGKGKGERDKERYEGETRKGMGIGKRDKER